MIKRLGRVWFILVVSGVVLSTTANAWAAEELRLKLDMDDNVLGRVSDAFTLRPMIRTEQRFREQGLVLLKVSVGMRANLFPWLMLQSYYAHKDKLSSAHDVIHILVLDVILHDKIGPIKISDRNGNEWHSSPGFYRYRNDLTIQANPGLDWLRLFVADELRFDSDQARLNMNDLKAGVEIIASPQLHFRSYFDLESNRRLREQWMNTPVLQLMMIVRLSESDTEISHGHEYSGGQSN